MIHVYKGSYLDFHYNVNDLKRVGRKVLENYRKDNDHIRKLRGKDTKDFKGMKTFQGYIDGQDLKKMKKEELYRNYQKAFGYHTRLLSRSHLLEGFGLSYDGEIKARVERFAHKLGKKTHELLMTLTTPVEKSFMAEEEQGLKEIFKATRKVKSFRQDARMKKMLEEHQKKYFWIQNTYAGSRVISVEEFAEKVENTRWEKEGPKPGTVEGGRLMAKLDKDTRELLELSNQLILWQDERKKEILIMIHYLDSLLCEIGRRKGIKPELMRFMLPLEVDEEKKITKSMLEQRSKACIITAIGDGNGVGISVLVGKEHEEFIKLLKQEEKEHIDEFSGMCASIGKALGRVRICKTLKDIPKMKQGEILVTVMTRPEHVPAMKKAAAIITDEGGITSHAAIISREMGIPCVIGTKIATKVLKDNDLVEVRANHGRISIIR
ncbi:MAG: hypothetical protein KJ709_05400 [Nanoarchaeota archaeon]|nr:hypothetical protein [Nanoarchaeota archaeon]